MGRKVWGSEARKRIDRELHGAVVRTEAREVARVVGDARFAAGAAEWWSDLRRGRLRLYGGLLRYIDVKVALNTPREELRAIPRWIDAYICEQCNEPNEAA